MHRVQLVHFIVSVNNFTLVFKYIFIYTMHVCFVLFFCIFFCKKKTNNCDMIHVFSILSNQFLLILLLSDYWLLVIVIIKKLCLVQTHVSGTTLSCKLMKNTKIERFA